FPAFPALPAYAIALEVKLRGDLEEPRRHDRQRIEERRARQCVRRAVVLLVYLGRGRVEQVVDVERQLCFRSAVLDALAEPQIHGIQAIAVELPGFDEVEELDALAAAEGPVQFQVRIQERGAEDGNEEREVERQHLSLQGLALDGRELVPGIRKAAER